MNVRKRLIGIPVAIVLGDGALKRCAEKKLADMRTRKILGGRIWLRLFHNPGAALGILKNNHRLLLAVNSGMFGAAVGAFVRLLRETGATTAKTGLALLIGGGASNLLDRLRRGYVTDYFSVNAGERFQRLRRVVFNVSDFCVFTGLILYLCGRKGRE